MSKQKHLVNDACKLHKLQALTIPDRFYDLMNKRCRLVKSLRKFPKSLQTLNLKYLAPSNVVMAKYEGVYKRNVLNNKNINKMT